MEENTIFEATLLTMNTMLAILHWAPYSNTKRTNTNYDYNGGYSDSYMGVYDIRGRLLGFHILRESYHLGV